MAKFGIGARVRDPDGDLCEVIGKPGGGERECRVLGGKFDGVTVNWPKSSLVPANDQEVVAEGDKVLAGQGVSENACGWVPKVGDRVKVVKHCNVDGHPLSLHAPIGSEHTITELRNYFADKGVPTFILSGGGFVICASANDEPVVAPATTSATDALTITAGKFYLTRDGRKVLVKENGTDGLYPFAHDNGCGGFHGLTRGGKSCINRDSADLVAEWVDPEPEVEVAEATATLKVGDRIVLVKDGLSTVGAVGAAGVIRQVVSSYEIHPYQIELDAGGTYESHASGAEQYRWTWASADCLAPEPSVPPAKFKVGDKVDLHRDGELVEQWRNMTITEDSRDGVFEFNTDVGLLCNSRELRLSPTIPIGSTVTFTATGRLSAINENGHMQVTFPGLPAARNSFALPADYVSLAN